METTRLSTKGRLILPKTLRTALKLGPGTEFSVERLKDGVLLRPLRALKPTRIGDVIGSAGYRGRRKSLIEQEAALPRRHFLWRADQPNP